MKEILDLKVFCNCVNVENKFLLTPFLATTGQERGLPVALSIRFDPEPTKTDLITWWEIKTILQKDGLIVVASDYEAFANGAIECLICSKKKQYKLNKIIASIKLAIGYLSTMAV